MWATDPWKGSQELQSCVNLWSSPRQLRILICTDGSGLSLQGSRAHIPSDLCHRYLRGAGVQWLFPAECFHFWHFASGFHWSHFHYTKLKPLNVVGAVKSPQSRLCLNVQNCIFPIKNPLTNECQHLSITDSNLWLVLFWSFSWNVCFSWHPAQLNQWQDFC